MYGQRSKGMCRWLVSLARQENRKCLCWWSRVYQERRYLGEFLVFDQRRRFVINQEAVESHILGLKRQLEKPKSVFGCVNALNKVILNDFIPKSQNWLSSNFLFFSLSSTWSSSVVTLGNRLIAMDKFMSLKHSNTQYSKITRAQDYNGSAISMEQHVLASGSCFRGVLNPIINPLEIRESLVSSPKYEFPLRMTWKNTKMPNCSWRVHWENRLAYWFEKGMQEVAFVLVDSYYEGYLSVLSSRDHGVL